MKKIIICLIVVILLVGVVLVGQGYEKKFCDRCSADMKDTDGTAYDGAKFYDLCNPCRKKLNKLVKDFIENAPKKAGWGGDTSSVFLEFDFDKLLDEAAEEVEKRYRKCNMQYRTSTYRRRCLMKSNALESIEKVLKR